MPPADQQYENPSKEQLQEIDDAIKTGVRISLSERDLRQLGPQLSRLRRPTLSRCDLRGVTLAGKRRQRIDWVTAELCQCLVDGLVFDRVDLRRARIEMRERRGGAPEGDDPERETLTFRRCNLQDATLLFGNGRPDVHFTDCKLDRATLQSNGPGPHLRFVRTTGLWGFDAARTHSLNDQDSARFHHLLDFPTWAFLRRIGATRLMSVSWVALIGLVIYANALRWYNDQIKSIHSRVTNSEAASWVDQLGPLPAPEQFGKLMLSILCIALAATILLWRCPPLVLHHTRHQWNLLSGKYDLEYQGASYDRWWSRWICALGYAGGIYAAVYLLVRVGNSVAYFFGWLGE